MGPMTGRAAGHCAGDATPGYASPGFGRGYGIGRGFGAGGGRGRRNMFCVTGLPGRARSAGHAAPYPYPASYCEPDPHIQESLKNQADALQMQLDLVKQRLSDLETGPTAE